jgi:hypothetical protein
MCESSHWPGAEAYDFGRDCIEMEVPLREPREIAQMLDDRNAGGK